MARGERDQPGGVYSADDLPTDRYLELSDGRRVHCQPAGGRHGARTAWAGLPLATDPRVESFGTDVGYKLGPRTVRAPDIAVGNVPSVAGFVPGAPPLAIEYADTGTDEADLREKIAQYLRAGTLYVWVVRLVGIERVEVHAKDQPTRLLRRGQELRAPELLQNPLPVDALFDEQVAMEVALRNLLARAGFESPEALREAGRLAGVEEGRLAGVEEGRLAGVEEGEARGAAKAVLAVLDARGVPVSATQRAEILAARDGARLARWLDRVATTPNVEALLDGA